MQTLTVNGKIYERSDPNAVTGQQLTEREQVLLGRLCPSFSESGGAVRCEPVEDYPLKVTTLLSDATDSLTLTLCGKNLFDCEKYTVISGSISAGGGAASSSSNFSRINEYIPVDHLRGQTISLNHPASEKTATTNMGLAFYDASQVYISGSSASAIVVPDTAAYMRFCVPKEYEDGTKVQLELGAVVTEFESYRERVYTVEFEVPLAAGENYAWSDIKAHAGVNTIWSSAGTTTVEGKSDPVAIFEKLTNAIISVGGNV